MVISQDLQNIDKYANIRSMNHQKKTQISTIPTPSVQEVERYLNQWDERENYVLQENALNKLFFDTYPQNTSIDEILVKASTLNDFYSTNIFSIFPVAKHIHSLQIDQRLRSGDDTLVGDIAHLEIGGKPRVLYSFATKYCSHHNPNDFPIYDIYVERVLCYFRDKDHFSEFKAGDLKDYPKFRAILLEFRRFYHLDMYNLKDIDRYVWQLGKEYFPRKY